MKCAWWISLLLVGCAALGGKPGTQVELAAATAEMVDLLSGVDSQLTWVGLRDASGKQTPATQAVEEYLVSALVRSRRPFSVADNASSAWSAEAVIGDDQLDTRWALGGRLSEDGPSTYLRLFLVDLERGEIAQTAVRSVRSAHVQREVEVRARAEGLGNVGMPLEVELHWVLLRKEGELRLPVQLSDGMSVREGDELQVRFRLNRDAQVLAFLYSSEGEVLSLVPDEFRYSGLPYYGPSENGWVTLSELDRVYTVYFMAGPRLLEENADEFYERLDEMVEQGQVDRFVGLAKQDQVVVEFLQRSFSAGMSIDVVRDGAEIADGREETLVYSDGTRLQSVAEKLNAPVVVRAISFSVQ